MESYIRGFEAGWGACVQFLESNYGIFAEGDEDHPSPTVAARERLPELLEVFRGP